MGATLLASRGADAADADTGKEPEPSFRTTEARTLASVPNGVDTYTAFVGERGMGASALGQLSGGNSAGNAAGGLRIWGGLFDRVVIQAEGANNEKGKFVPSLAVAGRLIGDRARGWALGALGRYRTEGLTTFEGEIEGGLIGSYAGAGLHLDASLVAGFGLEEPEADGEGLLRFGYDLGRFVRLGAEGRFRHEFGDEEERRAGAAEARGEWDAFLGPQATASFGHFFGMLTGGPAKWRQDEKLGWMAMANFGGVAF